MNTREERIQGGLAEEGYSKIYTQVDSAEKEYREHTHPYETAHIVVTGSMEITYDEKVYYLEKGDRCDVPRDMPHTARIGPSGCTYVIGERQ